MEFVNFGGKNKSPLWSFARKLDLVRNSPTKLRTGIHMFFGKCRDGNWLKTHNKFGYSDQAIFLYLTFKLEYWNSTANQHIKVKTVSYVKSQCKKITWDRNKKTVPLKRTNWSSLIQKHILFPFFIKQYAIFVWWYKSQCILRNVKHFIAIYAYPRIDFIWIMDNVHVAFKNSL